MQYLTEILQEGIWTASAIFLGIIMGILLRAFAKGVSSSNLNELFIDERSGHISHTKYWSNVAYLVVTFVFLVLNLFYFKDIVGNLEMIWFIYLGIVASNAAVSKLLSYKYGVKSESAIIQAEPASTPTPPTMAPTPPVA